MSDQKTETQPEVKKADEVDIIAKYNEFIEQIPWGALKSLPEKFGKYAGLLGIKDASDLNIARPVEDVVNFIGVIVKRIRTGEKRSVKLDDRVAMLESILSKEIELAKGKPSA